MLGRATVRVDLGANAGSGVGDVTEPTGRSHQSLWDRLCEPDKRRQVLPLFEVVASSARNPDRDASLRPMLAGDLVGPIEMIVARHPPAPSYPA